MSATEDKIVSNLSGGTPARVGSHASYPRLSLAGRAAKSAIVLIVAVLALDAAASLLVRRQSVRRRLDGRLAAAFGRPVETDGYSFSLWGGPTLQASGVIVSEDPRFGYEYFLRADGLSVRLRWSSLLRGRVDLGTLSLTGPTLNVEQNAAGEWNLSEWLGHPLATGQGAVRPQAAVFVPGLRRIQVDGGRVNFKRGNEKLPFAFVDVAGTISSGVGERWQVDLETSPWRAASILQRAGTIHLSGNIGGTSSALRPADLQMRWTAASLSDFLRLVQGDDRGLRGSFAMAVNAHTAGEGWALEGRTQFAGLHRWDLAERTDNPSFNLDTKVTLDLAKSSLQFTEASFEAPHSNAQAHGEIIWGGSEPRLAPAPRTRAKGAAAATTLPSIEISSASIDIGDTLAWVRAFRPGVPDGLAVRGVVVGHATLSGWPPAISDAVVTSTGADVSGGIRVPVHVGALHVNYGVSPSGSPVLAVAPTVVTFAPLPASGSGRSAAQTAAQPGGLFRVEVSSPASRGREQAGSALHISGSAVDATDLIAAANAFGWNASRGWAISGPVRGDLRWVPATASQWPWQVSPTGSVTLGDGIDAASLRVPFLNFPLTGIQARIDWKPGVRQGALTSAQAFGTRWSGTLERADSADQWTVSLSARRLNSADLDGWLNPRWRETLIARVLPFLNSPSDAVADFGGLRASGHLGVDEFVAPPFSIENLQGSLTIDGRHVAFANATGTLSGGKVSGHLDAQLDAAPVYSAHASFAGVDLSPASEASSSAASELFSGVASGEVDFSMMGASRQDLFGSLRCTGSLDVRDAQWGGAALNQSLASAALVSGTSVFRDASADFTCGNQIIGLKNIALSGLSGRIAGSGSIDFRRNLGLELRQASNSPVVGGAATPQGSAPQAAVLVTGTPDAPSFAPALAPRRAR
jgi:uncharacterized protein involved in outer membrane biogenesis